MDHADERPSAPEGDEGSVTPDTAPRGAQESLDFGAIETPEELAPHVSSGSTGTVELPPALDRERPARQPIRPAWLYPAIVTIVVVAGIAVAASLLWSAANRATVPDVTGRSFGLARTMLAQKGFEASIVERRFSARPADQVLAQNPAPGTELKRGDTVELIVSAGTEETRLPDVIGDGIILAKGTLEGLGLVVVVESTPSEVPSDTVLGTIPSPGTVVRSGDVVRVQVSAALSDADALQPYEMQGMTVTIDPVPLEGLTPDITLEIARRLRSLLEASGANVVVLRTTTSTSTAEVDRARMAAQSGSTVAVGLTASEKGPGGRTVSYVSAETSRSAQSERLAAAAVKGLAAVAPPAVETPVAADPVLRRAKAPWIRVGLGSFADSTDESAFTDPRWADRVARAIYSAIGEVFGSKDGQ